MELADKVMPDSTEERLKIPLSMEPSDDEEDEEEEMEVIWSLKKNLIKITYSLFRIVSSF